MAERICKNKKCQRPLPEGYKYKYCEHCRSEHASIGKKIGKGAFAAGSVLIAIVLKGHGPSNKA